MRFPRAPKGRVRQAYQRDDRAHRVKPAKFLPDQFPSGSTARNKVVDLQWPWRGTNHAEHLLLRKRLDKIVEIVLEKEEDRDTRSKRKPRVFQHLVGGVDTAALKAEIGDRNTKDLLQLLADRVALLNAVAIDHRVTEKHHGCRVDFPWMAQPA